MAYRAIKVVLSIFIAVLFALPTEAIRYRHNGLPPFHYPIHSTRSGVNPGNIGLSPSNLNVNGISVGFLPAMGEPISPNSPSEINKILSAPMAVMGSYIQLSSKDPALSKIDWQLREFSKLEGNPVWELALMPVEGLEMITPSYAHAIAKKMAYLNSIGITVWVRFAHEMNGDWYPWGMKPELFLQKWKLLTSAIRECTKKTYMLWAPNSAFRQSRDSLLGGYTPYWPGPEFVDIIGLSFYHYGGFERLNELPSPTEAQDVIKEFAKMYGSKNHDRPMVLAETAAAYTRSAKTGQPAPGNASEEKIKSIWLQQLLTRSLAAAVPELKAIVWFEVMKNENASEDTPIRTEDFRLVMGNVKPSSQGPIRILKSKS